MSLGWAAPIAVALVLSVLVPAARAHRLGLSGSRWELPKVHGQPLRAFVGFDIQALDRFVRLPRIDRSWTMEQRHAALSEPVMGGMVDVIRVSLGGQPCVAQPAEMELLRRGDVFEVTIDYRCPPEADGSSYDIVFEFFGRLPQKHRHLVRTPGSKPSLRSLGRWSPRLSLPAPRHPPPESSSDLVRTPPIQEPATTSGSSLFAQFLGDGILHFVTGWDHVLFLLALLVLGGGLGYLARIVTAFTLAHSLTLVLTALEVVSPSSSWVEPFIAASIVYVALENFWTREGRWRWINVSLLGLVHGFGFADSLRQWAIPTDEMAVPLFAFNLGVEVGQLAVVVVLYPLVHFAARHQWHRTHVVYPVSISIACVGTYWFVERVFFA